MAYILSSKWSSGKTYFASHAAFASDDDVLKCTCLFGSNCEKDDLDDPCHNNNKKLLSQDFLVMEPAERIALIDALERGEYLYFTNGCYQSTTGSTVSINSKTLFRMTKDRDCNNNYYYLSVRNGDSLVNLFSPWLFTLRTIEFEGFPYIRVCENAVDAPMRVSYPKFSSAPIEDGDHLILNDLNRQLSKFSNEWLKATSSEDLNEMSIVSQMLLSNYFSDNIKKEIADLRNKILKINNNNKAKLVTLKYEEVDRDDRIYLPKNGDISMYPVLILSILFKCTRCFIDSVGNLVYTLGGNAMAGGISTQFLRTLQVTDNSEAILFYSPLSLSNDVEPLARFDLGGYVNGHICQDELQRDLMLSERDLWCTTRHRSALNRLTPYVIHDAKNKLLYGNKSVFDYQKHKIYTYNELGLNGRYDEKLLYRGSSMLTTLTIGNNDRFYHKKPNAMHDGKSKSLSFFK